VATLDVARRRVRLGLDELGVAAVLALDPGNAALRDPESRGCLRRLEAAGAVADGQLVGYVAELVGLVAAPKLRIVVETFSGSHRVVHSVWADEVRATVGTSEVDDALDLSPVSTVMVPMAIAERVGLGYRPTPDRLHSITLPAAVLDAAVIAAAAGGREAAQAALERDAAELSAQECATVAALVADWRLSWRITSVWSEEKGAERTRSVSIVDGGPRGFWQSLTDEPADPGMRVTLKPLSPGAVWGEIVAMVPGLGVLADAYAD
jgi:hypothetical protein